MLEPCPFCGSSVQLRTDGITTIVCAGCGIFVSTQYRSIKKIMDVWNKRAHHWPPTIPYEINCIDDET